MESSMLLAPGGYGLTLLALVWAEFSVGLVLLLGNFYMALVLGQCFSSVSRRSCIVHHLRWNCTLPHMRQDLVWKILTFVTGMLSNIFLTLSICVGLGQHVRDLPGPQVMLAIKWSWFNQILAIAAIAFGKLALVAFLQLLHPPQARAQVLFLWLVAISNLIINAITISMILTQCTPVAKLWDDALPGNCDGRLRNQTSAYFQGSMFALTLSTLLVLYQARILTGKADMECAGWSALCDLVLATYPVFFLAKVRLKRTVKIGLCFLMGSGILYGPAPLPVRKEANHEMDADSACACAVIKTTQLAAISKTSDITFWISRLITWNQTEMWIILIVSLIPPLRPLLERMLNAMSSTGQAIARRPEDGRSPPASELRNQEALTGSQENLYAYGHACPTPSNSEEDIDSAYMGAVKSGRCVHTTMCFDQESCTSKDNVSS